MQTNEENFNTGSVTTAPLKMIAWQIASTNQEYTGIYNLTNI